MKFGVILPNYGPELSLADLLACTHTAERLGFDSIWATDHVVTPLPDSDVYGTIIEALMTLAYLAGCTSSIRLGISTLVLPQRNPVLAAKQVAALDLLSGGRAMLSVGLGWSRGEFANLGQPFENRARRMDEAIRVLRALFEAQEGRPVSLDGRFYALDKAVFSPAPPQGGDLPIWVAGNSPAAMERAAQLGDGWHPTSLDVDSFQPLAARFRASSDKEIALRLRLAWDSSDANIPLHGSHQEVINTLERYRAAGLTYALIHFISSGTMSLGDAMERFALQVVPVLGKAA